MNRSFVFVVSCLLLIVTVRDADAQWARFRGPNGSGVDLSAGYPVEFSPTRNMAWKASVPYGQSSPVVVGTRLYATASEGNRLITFCLDTRTGRELWRREVRRERMQGVYYMVKTGGIISSLDPATGRLLKEGRSPGALGDYASPVAADGKVFLANTEGKITVLKAAAEWEVLAVNELGDEISATPALSEGRLYVRTREAVYCFSTWR